jgi:hypothetical protein
MQYEKQQAEIRELRSQIRTILDDALKSTLQ